MGATAAAWETYLGSGAVPGMGPALAARVVARFGADVGTILDADPDRVREVHGIRPAVARALAAWWRTERRQADRMVELLAAGVPLWLAKRVVRAWRDDAVARVRRDPYSLMTVPGVGFATADAVARAQGVVGEDPRRWRGALTAVLADAEAEGHCGLPVAVWVKRAETLVGPSGGAARPIPPSAAWVIEGDWVAPAALHRAERAIERRWRMLLAARAGTEASADTTAPSPEDPPLTAAQAHAVHLALTAPISVLTGLPGTGKTTAVRAVVRRARARGERVRLMAPTGKAAKRLAEVAGAEATTIHRAVGWRTGETGPLGSASGAPLAADLVVVDEASMLDVRLARHLLEALAPGTRLWLVGDAAQLPPVGPGRVLADAIAHGGVPVVTLTTLHRQAASSPIVRLAHAVHDGRWPAVAGWREPDCAWIEADAEGAAAAAARVALAARERGDELQVLTAMRKGPDGVEALNAVLRDALNPGPDGWRGFRPGDRVVQTRNNRELDVVNGEQGVVLEAPLARRRVVVEFDGRPVVYEGASAGELDWAYAMTVHKAQGSEWPAVAIVLTRRQYVMARRALLYTAITRAKRRLVLIGETWAYQVAAANAREERRGSMLFRRPPAAGASLEGGEQGWGDGAETGGGSD